jgi:hypothetical protein
MIKISYLYIICVSLVPCYMIFRSIYLFKKNKYNPYIFGKNSKKSSSFLTICIALAMYICGIFFITEIKSLHILVYSFICFSVFLLICVNILNYLSFLKIKDRKIINHTVIFNITVIIIIYILIHFIIKAI